MGTLHIVREKCTQAERKRLRCGQSEERFQELLSTLIPPRSLSLSPWRSGCNYRLHLILIAVTEKTDTPPPPGAS